MVTFRLLTLALCAVLVPAVTPLNTQDDFELAAKGIEEYLRTRKQPDYLEDALKNYQLPELFRRNDKFGPREPDQICFLCNLVVDFIILERRAGLSRESLLEEADYLCIHLGIESRRVCMGVVDINIDIFLYIIDNSPNITSNRFCGLILQNLECPKGDDFDWSINIPEGVSPERPTSNDTQTFRVLQMSDIHYDPNYTPGGNAVCGEPMCCQGDQGEPTPETACGYWTDYRTADAPWHLVVETIRQANTQQFDYVYYTGDIISHRVWDTSIPNNTNSIALLYSYFKDNFNVPVYPIFGNHEPHPLDVWPPDTVTNHSFSQEWLFQLSADQWSQLVGEDISETVMKGGYYTVSPRPGFRIIAINSNFCYAVNWWLIYDDVDPYGQLQWLADTLKLAEDNNESVHILSHIPTGTSTSLSVWGREYSRIVNRFANTITGQFNGHTHKDEFHVYYNTSEPTQAVGVAFNGASVTPYTLSSPSYKIYDVDATTFALRDYEEWTFNLTLANSQPIDQSPEWYKLYSFVEAYGVASLEPAEVDKVVYKMAEDHTLLDNYFIYFYRNADLGISGGCDEECKRSFLCEIATTVYGEDMHCQRFLGLYDQTK